MYHEPLFAPDYLDFYVQEYIKDYKKQYDKEVNEEEIDYIHPFETEYGMDKQDIIKQYLWNSMQAS